MTPGHLVDLIAKCGQHTDGAVASLGFAKTAYVPPCMRDQQWVPSSHSMADTIGWKDSRSSTPSVRGRYEGGRGRYDRGRRGGGFRSPRGRLRGLDDHSPDGGYKSEQRKTFSFGVRKDGMHKQLYRRVELLTHICSSGKSGGLLFLILSASFTSSPHPPPHDLQITGYSPHCKAYPTAFTLAPTRELMPQIHEETNKFAYRSWTLVFVETKRMADMLSDFLMANSLPPTSVHGDRT
ncbi:hypothetical protein NEOLEDRAFT_1149196 [Neolentinus lepideus HHB14362 ss-1]|uniref:DEAD/DEAH box helicase domain-containing protein n=1 Tax=Neolentinus lepideus HHB14362 ss-1 TaxID=1314782 RepID=A0A165RE04_9AGAM|nr:hypothetical protein NEOLEDRAFT_1149196 [Neolentinus lepideus HHB14362 ss-1]